jgi:hypothetical protein
VLVPMYCIVVNAASTVTVTVWNDSVVTVVVVVVVVDN